MRALGATMANSLLTIDMITREAIMLFRNSNAFIQNLDRQYDDQYANDGAKIGYNLRIRLPNDYVVRTGTALSVQDTAEQSTTLVVSTQKGVDVGFSTAERTMQMDDYSERVLAPMINNLGGDVAATIMRGVEGGVSNWVSNVDGSGAIVSPTSRTVLESGALLSKRSAPMANRNLVADPFTMAHMVETMQGLFNPSTKISKQYDTAQIYQALNYKWFEDQTVLVHTTGTFSAGTVNGAGQSGTTLVTNAITGTFRVGDIITIAGVNSVNRVTKQDDGMLQQFVVTANVLTGATSIPIYPAIIAPVGGNAVQYQTVAAAPANGAALALVNQASEVYRKNVAYVPSAITMVTADLIMPKKVEEAARERFDGLSMRMLTAYLPGTDQLVTRLDILFGYLFIRPEWCVAIPDTV
jgi:hypothetical protein